MVNETTQVIPATNIVSKLPIKGFLLILVFAIGIFGANWYIDGDVPWVPFEERCSSHYPRFAVELDHPQFLEDGSVQSEGQTYPTGAFWVGGGVVRGCPCSIRFCVKRCCCCGGCSEKCSESKNVTELFGSVHSNFYETNISGYHNGQLLNSSSYVLGLKELYILKNVTSLKTFYQFYLIENIAITSKIQNKSLDQSKSCLNETNAGDLFVNVCSETDDTGAEDIRGGALVLIQILMTASIVVNTVTLVVFALLPRLRSGYGYGLMSYVASRGVKTLASQVFYMGWLDDLLLPCMLLGATIQFFETASRAWQVVTSYQMWAAFRPGIRGPEGTQELDGRLLYIALAWGLPLGLAVVTLLMDLVPGVPDTLRPLYGQPSCWYNNLTSLYIFFVIPVGVGELANLVRCVCTLRCLGQCQRDSGALRGSENRCHNTREIRWSSIYLKVCLVMGVNYILGSVLVLISWTSRTADFFRYAAETVMHMRGIEVFFIFVLKKKILKQLLHRVTDVPQSRSLSTKVSRIKSNNKDNPT